MRRTMLLLTVMGLALVLASGIALAATFTGTKRADTINGSDNRDFIYGLNGDDTLSGGGGNLRQLRLDDPAAR